MVRGPCSRWTSVKLLGGETLRGSINGDLFVSDRSGPSLHGRDRQTCMSRLDAEMCQSLIMAATTSPSSDRCSIRARARRSRLVRCCDRISSALCDARRRSRSTDVRTFRTCIVGSQTAIRSPSPQRQCISVQMSVAYARSVPAPTEGSPNTRISASRPAKCTARMSCTTLRVSSLDSRNNVKPALR